MKTFRVNKSQNVNEVESELERLQREGSCDLQLPVKVTDASIGGEASLIQFIISWAKKCPDSRLITHVQPSQDAARQLDRMVKTGFGFVACLMAKEIVDVHGKESLSQLAYSLASARVDKMNHGPDAVAHGNRVLLAAVDQSTRWQLAPFYFSDGKVRGRKEFRHLAESLVKVRAASKLTDHMSEPTYRGLGVVLHELFRNTHDWARTNVSGVPIRRSVRGILVDSRNLEFSAIKSAAEGSQALDAYVNHNDLVSDDGRFRCVEISIFDSGPGLAPRWLGRSLDADVSIRDEYDACMECLKKHRSTSGRSHAGIGLFEVVRTLSPLRGFMRLRTGRLALYRDFVNRPLQESEVQGASDLDDWATGTGTLKEKPFVEGALFTLLIPLVRRGR